jgi:hypothetical protein
METRHKSYRHKPYIGDICNAIVSNFTKEIPHENNIYNLKLTPSQTSTISSEVWEILNSLELSKTQESIQNKLSSDEFNEFIANIAGYLSFESNFSLFDKLKNVKIAGLTELFYKDLIFDLNAFNKEKFWNSWALKPLGGGTAPEKDLKTRFNMQAQGERKELIIAVYCKTLANFGSAQDHLNLAKELQVPDNKIIAAMRKPYGKISFMSSAKEINSKAYFDYQHHIFSILLGEKIVSTAFNDKKLPLELCGEINFFLKPRDIKSLTCLNRAAAKTSADTQKEYGEKYFRKRI